MGNVKISKIKISQRFGFYEHTKNYLYPKNGYVLNFSDFYSFLTSSSRILNFHIAMHQEVNIGESGHAGLQDDATYFEYAK